MNAKFGDQFYPRYILEISAVSFNILFFTILHVYILYIEYTFGHVYDKILKQFKISSVVERKRCTEVAFHFNNRLKIPLNLKRNCTLKYTFSCKIHPF